MPRNIESRHLAAAPEALPSSNSQYAVLKAAGALCNRTTTNKTPFRETIWNLRLIPNQTQWSCRPSLMPRGMHAQLLSRLKGVVDQHPPKHRIPVESGTSRRSTRYQCSKNHGKHFYAFIKKEVIGCKAMLYITLVTASLPNVFAARAMPSPPPLSNPSIPHSSPVARSSPPSPRLY